MAGVKRRHPPCFLTEPELCVTIFQRNQNGEREGTMQRVERGRGKINQVKEFAAALGMKRPMLVTGSSGKRVLQQVLGDAMQFPVFSDFHSNPDLSDCDQGCRLYQREGCDGLISLGGGSCMDTAKGIKAQLLYILSETALKSLCPMEKVPHLAIPSTAGTGSEATQFSVLYVHGVKRSLSHPSLLPDGVILDADLLRTLPLYQKKCCALDALCQGIESYWAREATEESRVQAYLAIRGVLNHLKAYLAGHGKAEEEMLEAAFRSGCAIQMTRTTAAHAMSYQLTKQFDMAHGHACMVTLPFLWARMMEDPNHQPMLRELAGIMGLGSELMVPSFLSGILLSMELPLPHVADDQALEQLADTVNLERLQNHPQVLTRADLMRIYRQALTPLSGSARQVAQDLWAYYG